MPQTDITQVMEYQKGTGIAEPSTSQARTVAWARGARIVQGLATLFHEAQMEEETRFVGIDIPRGQVDLADSPTIQRWVVYYDKPGVG